jgi:hypothetical protein
VGSEQGLYVFGPFSSWDLISLIQPRRGFDGGGMVQKLEQLFFRFLFAGDVEKLFSKITQKEFDKYQELINKFCRCCS